MGLPLWTTDAVADYHFTDLGLVKPTSVNYQMITRGDSVALHAGQCPR